MPGRRTAKRTRAVSIRQRPDSLPDLLAHHHPRPELLGEQLPRATGHDHRSPGARPCRTRQPPGSGSVGGNPHPRVTARRALDIHPGKRLPLHHRRARVPSTPRPRAPGRLGNEREQRGARAQRAPPALQPVEHSGAAGERIGLGGGPLEPRRQSTAPPASGRAQRLAGGRAVPSAPGHPHQWRTDSRSAPAAPARPAPALPAGPGGGSRCRRAVPRRALASPTCAISVAAWRPAPRSGPRDGPAPPSAGRRCRLATVRGRTGVLDRPAPATPSRGPGSPRASDRVRSPIRERSRYRADHRFAAHPAEPPAQVGGASCRFGFSPALDRTPMSASDEQEAHGTTSGAASWQFLLQAAAPSTRRSRSRWPARDASPAAHQRASTSVTRRDGARVAPTPLRRPRADRFAPLVGPSRPSSAPAAGAAHTQRGNLLRRRRRNPPSPARPRRAPGPASRRPGVQPPRGAPPLPGSGRDSAGMAATAVRTRWSTCSLRGRRRAPARVPDPASCARPPPERPPRPPDIRRAPGTSLAARSEGGPLQRVPRPRCRTQRRRAGNERRSRSSPAAGTPTAVARAAVALSSSRRRAATSEAHSCRSASRRATSILATAPSSKPGPHQLRQRVDQRQLRDPGIPAPANRLALGEHQAHPPPDLPGLLRRPRHRRKYPSVGPRHAGAAFPAGLDPEECAEGKPNARLAARPAERVFGLRGDPWCGTSAGSDLGGLGGGNLGQDTRTRPAVPPTLRWPAPSPANPPGAAAHPANQAPPSGLSRLSAGLVASHRISAVQRPGGVGRTAGQHQRQQPPAARTGQVPSHEGGTVGGRSEGTRDPRGYRSALWRGRRDPASPAPRAGQRPLRANG